MKTESSIEFFELSNSMEHSPYWEVISHSDNQEISLLYGTRSFIALFTTAHQ